MSYEEGGTQSRSTKVKTNQGFYKKKNVRKTYFQHRHSRKPMPIYLEDLTDATFSSLIPATIKNTIKRLLGYETLKYSHYTCKSIHTG